MVTIQMKVLSCGTALKVVVTFVLEDKILLYNQLKYSNDNYRQVIHAKGGGGLMCTCFLLFAKQDKNTNSTALLEKIWILGRSNAV